MTTEFETVPARGQAAFTVQGSEFIGHVAPAQSIDEAEEIIADVQSEYHDATHNVPAYRVREGDFLREYQSDEGEPAGSAGKPVLGVLEGKELKNVVAVVTRYYGGTNLGIGGLVSAYTRATKEAVADAGVVTEIPKTRVVVETAYDDLGTVNSIIESEGVAVTGDYGETVTFELLVPESAVADLLERLRSATSGRVDIQFGSDQATSTGQPRDQNG